MERNGIELDSQMYSDKIAATGDRGFLVHDGSITIDDIGNNGWGERRASPRDEWSASRTELIDRDRSIPADGSAAPCGISICSNRGGFRARSATLI